MSSFKKGSFDRADVIGFGNGGCTIFQRKSGKIPSVRTKDFQERRIACGIVSIISTNDAERICVAVVFCLESKVVVKSIVG